MDDPHLELAVSIINQAIFEWRFYRHKDVDLYVELVQFFQGEWFEDLAGWGGVHPDTIRKELEIP